MLSDRRPNYIGGDSQTAAAILEKRLELCAIALSPIARIEPRQQARSEAVHSASSLLSPALLNCCSVVSFARNTPTPSAVMR